MLNVSNTVVATSLLFLFQSAAVPPAHSGERHVVLTNNTRERLIEIYVSDDGTDNWQGDLLGLEFLLPDSSVPVDVDDRNGNCRVDVKTVLNNGSSLVYRRVNVCLAEGQALLPGGSGRSVDVAVHAAEGLDLAAGVRVLAHDPLVGRGVALVTAIGPTMAASSADRR